MTACGIDRTNEEVSHMSQTLIQSLAHRAVHRNSVLAIHQRVRLSVRTIGVLSVVVSRSVLYNWKKIEFRLRCGLVTSCGYCSNGESLYSREEYLKRYKNLFSHI